MRTLQDRYDEARHRLKLYRAFEEQTDGHNRAIRAALRELLDAAPGLAEGRIPGATGGVVRQKIIALQGLANRPPSGLEK